MVVKINAANVFPLMQVFGKIMSQLEKTPIPNRHRTVIKEVVIENKTEWVVIMKVSYTKKEDAENFVKLDELVDKAVVTL